MEMTGNTVLITGGTSSIELAFAEKFLELGNKIIICVRREYILKKIQKEHKEIITMECDVSKKE